MDHNKIAALLLCPISKKLPIDPVIGNDGFIYDRRFQITGKVYFPSNQIKRVIEQVIASGNVDEKYLGDWAKERNDDDEDSVNISPVDNTHGTNEDEFLLIKAKADAGDAAGMVELGEMYLKRGEEKEGYSCFVEASQKENEMGAARKADCLLSGLGVKQNHEEGHRMLFEAAIEGSAPAVLRLWYYYSEGTHGYNKNKSKEEKWLKKLKTICPHSSVIHQMRQGLIDLICPPLTKDTDSGNLITPPSGDENKVEIEQGTPIVKVEHKKVTPCCLPDSINTSVERSAAVEDVPLDEDEKLRITTLHPKNDQLLGPGQIMEQVEEEGGKLKSANDEDQVPNNGVAEQDIIPKDGATTGNEGNGEKQTKPASTSNTDEATDAKECFSCNISRPKNAFTPSQWKQPTGTGRCINCCKEEAHASNASSSNQAVTADKIYAENETNRPAPSALQNVKPCFQCNSPKPQAEFTASQWKKRVGTGKCIVCVSQSIQWKTSSVGTSLQLKVCGQCGENKPHAEFSPNQWRRPAGSGRCKHCVQQSLC